MDKNSLHKHCTELLKTRIADIQLLIADAQNASNNDTKSSMGDKYETTREMMQIEINKLMNQLKATQQMLLELKIINPDLKTDIVVSGSLIDTNNYIFYLSTSLGKISFAGKDVMVVSPNSPIGTILSGKKIKDSFELNGSRYTIHGIE